MSVLEMNNIQKHFGDLEVLKDISLSVNKGEVLSIIGPSGSGKSTLAKVITGLLQADTGEVVFDGEMLYSKKKQRIRAAFSLE